MNVKRQYAEDGLLSSTIKNYPSLKRITIVFVSLCFMIFGGEISICKADKLNQKIDKLNTGVETILHDVLDDICKQTGYKIVVSEKLSSVPVVGVYKDITIDDFLRRVLKKQNVSVLYDKKKKLVLVRGFGESIRQDQNRDYFTASDGVGDEEAVAPSEAVDPLSGLPLVESLEKQAQQMEELKRRDSDPEAVDPLSGIPLAELLEKQTQQLEELERRENDPDAVDLLSGIPLVELREKESRQLEELKNRETDPEAIDPQSGIPFVKLREKQARQLEQLKVRENDSEAVDPLSGIPLVELQEKQSRQLELLGRRQDGSN